MRKFILAALLAGTVATPAFAQEATPFTGFRVEALAGYDMLKSGERDDGTETSEDEGDESIDGIAYGAGVGFDFDLGSVVAGIEAEYMESNGEQETDETIDAPFTSRIGIGRDIYVGGRVGFKASPNMLAYVKGGYTKTGVEGSFEDDTDLFEFDENIDGWRLGAGLEFLFGANAYGKVEYRYSKYSDLEFDDTEFEADIDLDRHQVVAGIGFRL